MEEQQHFISLIYSSDRVLAYRTTMNQHLNKICSQINYLVPLFQRVVFLTCHLEWELSWPQRARADATRPECRLLHESPAPHTRQPFSFNPPWRVLLPYSISFLPVPTPSPLGMLSVTRDAEPGSPGALVTDCAAAWVICAIQLGYLCCASDPLAPE